MWASDASHLSDVVISIMRPIRYWNPDKEPEIEIGGKYYSVDDEAMIVTVLKQRFDRGFGQIGVKFVPQTLQMEDMGLIDLNRVESWDQEDLFNEE